MSDFWFIPSTSSKNDHLQRSSAEGEFFGGSEKADPFFSNHIQTDPVRDTPSTNSFEPGSEDIGGQFRNNNLKPPFNNNNSKQTRFFNSPRQIQKCEACEQEEEDKTIRRKPHEAGVMDPAHTSIQYVQKGSAFSDAGLYNNNNAIQLNDHLHADAFTNENDINVNQNKTDHRTSNELQWHAPGLHPVVRQPNIGNMVQKDDEEKPVKEESKQVDPLYNQFIPTASLRFTLGEAVFVLPPESSFQPGPKMPQVLSIILKKLLGDGYAGTQVPKLEKYLEGKKDIKKFGYLKQKNAYAGELIGGIIISTEVFEEILTHLNIEKLKWVLTDEEKKQYRLAYYNVHLSADIFKMAKEEGLKMPPWYNLTFFNRHMDSFRGLLEEYSTLYEELVSGKDPEVEKKGKQKIVQIYNIIEADVIFMESIRKDNSLAINPVTQLAYNAIWNIPDKKNISKLPFAFKSMSTALQFLNFARPKADLFIDAETQLTARVSLLQQFANANIIEEKDVVILPPFPSLIVAPDLNPDNTTVTSATNFFRMVIDFPKVHGSNLVHGVTVEMQMDTYYSWSIYPLPEPLMKIKEKDELVPDQMVEATSEFVKNSPDHLGTPVATIKADRDRDQKISMKNLGVGDFMVAGHAAPIYKKDQKRVQHPSSAGYPFKVFNAADLAFSSAYADIDAIEELKRQAASAEPKEKEALQKEIERLENREKQDLLSMTGKDIEDTEKLLKTTGKLKKFIEDDKKQGLSYFGKKDVDPFVVRLRNYDELLYNVYVMIRQIYPGPKYGDLGAVNEYIKNLNEQLKELRGLEERTGWAYGLFRKGSPQFRVVAGLVKSDDGNLVPLILVAGYHKDSDPEKGKYKIKLVDVTFKAADKDDMVYVGDEKSSEKDAVHNAFIEFGEDNKYGNGVIIYRLPGTSYSGNVKSVTTTWEYLQYAIAALGLVLLVAGVLASGGLLTPAAATVVGLLGIGLGVVGAIMSAKNISNRQEKGTLEMDSETALDIVNIIAGVVLPIGALTRISMAAKATTLARVIAVQRLDKLLMVYDAVDFASNVYLINAKVKEDVEAIKQLGLPKHEEDNMIAAVTFDALQQAAMMSVSAYGVARQVGGHFKSKVENSSYRSWEQKGWIIKEKNGSYKVGADAPPFLKKYEGNATLTRAEMGERARKEVVVEPLDNIKTHDDQHQLTLTEKGRIIRCSEFCSDLRMKYANALVENPGMQKQLSDIEVKAKDAAATGDKQKIKQALQEAKDLEGFLKIAEDLQSIKTGGTANLKAGETISFPYKKGSALAEVVQVGKDYVKLKVKSKSKSGDITQTLTRKQYEQYQQSGRIIRWTVERVYLMENRPKHSDDLINTVWDTAKGPDGQVRDPHTKEVLVWDKSKDRSKQWHMGHKPGKEYSKLVDSLIDGKISYDDFIREYNNADNYHPEHWLENISHKHEEK